MFTPATRRQNRTFIMVANILIDNQYLVLCKNQHIMDPSVRIDSMTLRIIDSCFSKVLLILLWTTIWRQEFSYYLLQMW